MPRSAQSHGLALLAEQSSAAFQPHLLLAQGPTEPAEGDSGWFGRLRGSYDELTGSMRRTYEDLSTKLQHVGEQVGHLGEALATLYRLLAFVGLRVILLLALTMLLTRVLTATAMVEGRLAFLLAFVAAAVLWHYLALIFSAGTSGGLGTVSRAALLLAIPLSISAGARWYWHRRRLRRAGRAFSPDGLTTDATLRRWLSEFEEQAAALSRMGHSVLAAQGTARDELRGELQKRLAALSSLNYTAAGSLETDVHGGRPPQAPEQPR